VGGGLKVLLYRDGRLYLAPTGDGDQKVLCALIDAFEICGFGVDAETDEILHVELRLVPRSSATSEGV